MSSVDMKHLAHLEQVAKEDVESIRAKEATYQGSWKRRGGVGAFMMLARKWDRLETILGGQWNYNVFKAIEAQCTAGTPGADGTVLAEVRDLRRYLMLVETELVARGAIGDLTPVVTTPKGGGRVDPCVPRIPVEFTDRLGRAVRLGDRVRYIRSSHTGRLQSVHHGEAAAVWCHVHWDTSRLQPPQGQLDCSLLELVEAGTQPGTPEDGGQHAERVGGTVRLADGCTEEEMGEALASFKHHDLQLKYLLTGRTTAGPFHRVVDRRTIPEEYWEHLPRWAVDLNDKEFEQLPAEYQGLYTRNSPDEEWGKWMMAETYREHWGKQP